MPVITRNIFQFLGPCCRSFANRTGSSGCRPSCVTIGHNSKSENLDGPRLPAAQRCKKRSATFSSIAVLSSSPLMASRRGGCLWPPGRHRSGSLSKSASSLTPWGVEEKVLGGLVPRTCKHPP